MKVFLALISGIAGYSAWYYASFHQFCPAMWHGTAPPLIIGIVALSVYRFLDRMSSE